jgi:hypothetical protein
MNFAKLRMPNLCRFAALALSLTACASNNVPGGGENRDLQAQSAYRMIPKERSGSVRLGMSVSDVLQILGRPQSSGAVYPDGFFFRYGCLEITFTSRESVRRMRVGCAEYKTAQGLRVQASRPEGVRTYGPLLEENAYEDPNIQFVQCGRTNRICEVAVWLRY